MAGLLDFDRPIALLALSALHFVPDDRNPTGILREYGQALAPGSLLALTHGSDDHPEHPDFERAMREVAALYASTSNPAQLRSRTAIRALVLGAGFVPDGDGLVELRRWARPPRDQPLGVYALISEPLSGR